MRKKEPVVEKNSPLKDYKEKQRAETLANIDNAIIQLHEQHLPLTMRFIAEAVGMSVQSMYKPYIKSYINNHPLVVNCREGQIQLDNESEKRVMLETKVAELTQSLANLKLENDKLKSQIEVMRNENRELLRNNRSLMGRIQMKEHPIKFEQL